MNVEGVAAALMLAVLCGLGLGVGLTVSTRLPLNRIRLATVLITCVVFFVTLGYNGYCG